MRGYRCLEGRNLSVLRLGSRQLLGDEGGWIGKLRWKMLWSTWMLQEVVLEAQYMILCSPGSASPPQLPSKVPAEPLALQENMNEEIQLSLAELTALSRVQWTLRWFHQASVWILARRINLSECCCALLTPDPLRECFSCVLLQSNILLMKGKCSTELFR